MHQFSNLNSIENISLDVSPQNLDSIQDAFLKYEILEVHELHIHELSKFVLRSCSLYEFEARRKSNRSSVVSKLSIAKANTKLLRNSIQYRGARLFNLLQDTTLDYLYFC